VSLSALASFAGTKIPKIPPPIHVDSSLSLALFSCSGVALTADFLLEFRHVEFSEDRRNSFAPAVSFRSCESVVTCPENPQVFNRLFTLDIVQQQLVRIPFSLSGQMTNVPCQNACAEILLPILQRERDHIQQPGLIRRPREVEYRVLCGAFAQSFCRLSCS
jgi:hypothetical protein